MLIDKPTDKRELKTVKMDCDLAVIGGGLAGTCCALTAARAGVKVVLIQDRPVLGGNASSEVRLWALGATAHMSNNNRWAREGGVVDEILVENLWRNKEGNPIIFDTILLEKVAQEPNVTLLLNTAAFEVTKSDPDTITSVRAFCSQNSTMYEVRAPLFCDASGDGIVGFLSGAAFRMGAESTHEFGEKFAPSKEYGELLGHSIYFYSKDVGEPIKFVAPSYALKDITQVPRYRNFNAQTHGCRLWWIEWGGRLDTVHDTEKIKWELWKVVYGVWDYIKNSGKFPEAETMTLEWVGCIPGKRESRRFEGDYLLRQQDIVEQRHHNDAVSFGGWSIDLHPADGIYSEKPGCDQWHAKGVYQIPYRCLYSRNIKNLFLAGRIISTSHVAFGSTRVMLTCANSAQAVGVAATLCCREKLRPADLTEPTRTKRLQRELMKTGQHIPGFRLEDPDDLARRATITASSRLRLEKLSANGPLIPLTTSHAQMLPLPAGRVPVMTFLVHADAPTTLRFELRTSSRPNNHTPDVVLAAKSVELREGQNQHVTVDFGVNVESPRYVFVCLMKNEHVRVHGSQQRVTGILSVRHTRTQKPQHDIGVETFEMWCPSRRPGGHNFTLILDPPIDVFGAQNVTNGIARPTHAPNAWVADFDDPQPTLTLRWDRPQTIARLDLAFDTDWDHAMETVLMGHPENAIPFCVRHARVRDAAGKVVAELADNHQPRRTLLLNPAVTTDKLAIELVETWGQVPAALFEVRCYETAAPSFS
jgi:hypothetical protein